MHLILRAAIMAAVTLFAVRAQAQEREWSWDVTDTDAFLVFGTPNTDDVGLSLWCKLNSGVIKLYVPVPHHKLKEGSRVDLRVLISGAEFKVKGVASVNPETSTPTFEADLDPGGDLLPALSEASFFTAIIGDHTASFPLIDANLRDLVKVCK